MPHPSPSTMASLAFEPVRRLRGGEHYARPSPRRRAQPPWPQAPPPSCAWASSRCRQGSWGRGPPPHPVLFAAPCGRQGAVGFRFRAQFTADQKCGVWLAAPPQSHQAQESLGSIWPVLQYRGNTRRLRLETQSGGMRSEWFSSAFRAISVCSDWWIKLTGCD